jgi:hypothetical protein
MGNKLSKNHARCKLQGMFVEFSNCKLVGLYIYKKYSSPTPNLVTWLIQSHCHTCEEMHIEHYNIQFINDKLPYTTPQFVFASHAISHQILPLGLTTCVIFFHFDVVTSFKLVMRIN